MKTKIFSIVFLLTIVMLLTACTKVTDGSLNNVILYDKMIKNGKSTTLMVDIKNTGDLPAEYELKITPENSTNKVQISPQSMSLSLGVREFTGNKPFEIKGSTDYTLTTYKIFVQLFNKANGALLDQKLVELTVTK